jgi:hypothetical protein
VGGVPPAAENGQAPTTDAVVRKVKSGSGGGGGGGGESGDGERGSIYLTLTAGRKPFHYEKDFQMLGLEPSKCHILVVKIGYLVPDLERLVTYHTFPSHAQFWQIIRVYSAHQCIDISFTRFLCWILGGCPETIHNCAHETPQHESVLDCPLDRDARIGVTHSLICV